MFNLINRVNQNVFYNEFTIAVKIYIYIIIFIFIFFSHICLNVNYYIKRKINNNTL